MSTDSPPRSRMKPERLAELFEAVRGLLTETGYERLTFDAVAARARTSKATLYRHWGGSKADLVMAALTHERPGLPDHAGATSLDEVLAWMARADCFSTSDLRLAFMLLHAAAGDPGFGAALRKEIITRSSTRWPPSSRPPPTAARSCATRRCSGGWPT